MRRLILLCVLAAPLLGGCAIFNRDNTPTLNLVREHLLPESAPARYFAYPPVFVVGLVAVTVDMVAVHPFIAADDALYDTRDAFWKASSFDWNRKYVTECLTILPRSAFSPVVFVGCFLGRSSFDIQPNGGNPRTRTRYPHHPAPPTPDEQETNRRAEAQQSLIDDARKAYDEGRYADALPVLDKALAAGYYKQAAAHELQLACLARLHRVAEMIDQIKNMARVWGERHTFENDSELMKDVAAEICRVLREGTPGEKVRVLGNGLQGNLFAAALDEFPALVNGPDKALAMYCVERLHAHLPVVRGRAPDAWPPDSAPGKALALLEAAANSPDPTIAAAAQFYLQARPR